MNKDAIHLTKRMRQTLILTSMGLTAKEIGAALKVTPRTVRHYQAELKRYLSADSLAHLVTVAIRRGLVSMSLTDDDLDDLNSENPMADIEL